MKAEIQVVSLDSFRPEAYLVAKQADGTSVVYKLINLALDRCPVSRELKQALGIEDVGQNTSTSD